MIFFVMNGATHDSSGYSSLYLYEYQFNNQSDISNLLATQYSQQHDGKKLSDFSMKVGFMGICVDFGDDLDCGYTSDMKTDYDDKVPSFSVTNNKNTTSSATLELFTLAETLQNKATKYQIFIVEIITLLVLLVAQLYNMISFLPFQIYIQWFILFVLTVFFTIICISISWVMISCANVMNLGSVMTMNILSFAQGKKPQNVLWAAFALCILQVIFYIWTIINGDFSGFNFNRTKKPSKDMEKDISSIDHSILSSISTLRGTL
ncbi:Fig1 protein [Pichia kluyveri]|uniref:Fig1 protein n=1 Tax=Pichia kluyveri TaxID=36015 RepID=A0AAV5R0A7_PICKL|nr:Fig1 protein [Pichia kluyveri]